jgi:cell division protein FtsI (penicillin-binding protein 3)
MNAVNGEILALANEPSFNPNEKMVSPDRRRNRAITDGYEPGSTFKAILLAGALSHGSKLTDQVWGERGAFTVQGHTISEAEAKEKFEWVSLKKMIQVSSNVAAAKIAMKLGADSFLKTIRSFGIGSKSGLGFPGEISGKILARKDWGPLSLANVGFGQGILVTPIQMTRAYAAILNGGYLVTPTLILGEKDGQSKNSKENLERIISAKVSRDVIEALLSVTGEGGTGKKAALPGFDVAGKTGTAQMVDTATGKYSREKYVASFIGFPAGVDPKIVVFTSVVEPRGVYYASETAAPLFKEVLASAANRCSLPVQNLMAQDKDDDRNKDQLKVTQASANIQSNDPSNASGQNLNLVVPVSLEPSGTGWVMPVLKGLTPRESMRALRGHKFHVLMSGSGIISNQVPEAGKVLAEGDTIRLVLSDP